MWKELVTLTLTDKHT